MVFRTSHNLGPDLEQKGPYYWDGALPAEDASYRLGNPELGSDGHIYVHVISGGTIAAGTEVTIDETTWIATAGAGGFEVPAGLEGGVVEGEPFQARRAAL